MKVEDAALIQALLAESVEAERVSALARKAEADARQAVEAARYRAAIAEEAMTATLENLRYEMAGKPERWNPSDGARALLARLRQKEEASC